MVAHLAGALGVPVWLLLIAEPDWRWPAGGAGSPWYRNVRKYQADYARRLGPPVAELAADLTRLGARSQPGGNQAGPAGVCRRSWESATVADRHPRADDHLVLGQRPRDHLSRPGPRPRAARPPGSVPRTRQALVRREPRPAAPALRRDPALRQHRGTRPALGRSDRRCRPGPRRLLCPGRDRRRHTRAAPGRPAPPPSTTSTPRSPWPRSRPAPASTSRRTCCRGFDLYLSFTGGPTLDELENRFGARAARALYCSADPDIYRPDPAASQRWDLGYLGTYSPDRQPTLDALLCQPGRRHGRTGRFVVAGPLYPPELGLARQCRADRAPRPRTAPRLLRRPALHPERDPRRHDPPRLQPQRPPVRGGVLRRADHQRLVAGSRRASSGPARRS